MIHSWKAMMKHRSGLGLTYQNRKTKIRKIQIRKVSKLLKTSLIASNDHFTSVFFQSYFITGGKEQKSLIRAEESCHASLNCRGKIWTMWKLTRLQIANFHRQLERWDIIRSHNPLCTAAPPVLNTEGRDRRAAVGSRDPGNIHRTFSCHGDGGAIRSLGYWQKQIKNNL